MRDEGFGQGGKILPGWRYRTGYIYIYIYIYCIEISKSVLEAGLN